MFLDYFKKKKEDGIKSDNMFQQFRYLRKVYLYLFSHEFESTNVEEYMKMVSDGSDNQSDPGICPHCGEVICVFCKVENILKGSLDLIPSPSTLMKIQIMGEKVCLMCKGKPTFLPTF